MYDFIIQWKIWLQKLWLKAIANLIKQRKLKVISREEINKAIKKGNFQMLKLKLFSINYEMNINVVDKVADKDNKKVSKNLKKIKRKY